MGGQGSEGVLGTELEEREADVKRLETSICRLNATNINLQRQIKLVKNGEGWLHAQLFAANLQIKQLEEDKVDLDAKILRLQHSCLRRDETNALLQEQILNLKEAEKKCTERAGALEAELSLLQARFSEVEAVIPELRAEIMDLTKLKIETAAEIMDLKKSKIEAAAEIMDLKKSKIEVAAEIMDLKKSKIEAAAKIEDLTKLQIETAAEIMDLKKSKIEAVFRQLALDIEYDFKRGKVVPAMPYEKRRKYILDGECFVSKIEDLDYSMLFKADSVLKQHVLQDCFNGREWQYQEFRATMLGLKEFSHTGAHPVMYNGQEIDYELLKKLIDSSDFDPGFKRRAKEQARRIYPENLKMTAKLFKARKSFA